MLVGDPDTRNYAANIVIDLASYEHLLGMATRGVSGFKNYDTNTSYGGFLWSVKVWATAVANFGGEVTSSLTCNAGCTVCPNQNCLG